MGYQTYMCIEISEGGPALEQVAEKVGEVTGEPGVAFWESALQGEGVKWYDRESDMRKVSTRFPEAVFTLRGEGEDPGDQWVEYYKNGKLQVEERPEWNPPPFDPAKLK